MLSRRTFMQTTMAATFAALLGPHTAFGTPADSARSLDALLGEGTTVRITPQTTWSEKPITFTFTITLGKHGLPRGQSIGIVNGSYIDRWNFNFPSHHWGGEPPWQVDEPAAANHVTGRCNRADVAVRLAVGDWGGNKPYCNEPAHMVRSIHEHMRYVLEVSPNGKLEEGDTITLQWDCAAAPAFAARYFFLPFIFANLPEKDRFLPIRQGRFEDLPRVRVRGHDAVRLHVACQPMVGVEESFALTMAAIDQYGNPAEDFTGEVALACDAAADLPARVRFTPEDAGHKRVEGLRLKASGWHRIAARSETLSGQSNYLIVSEALPSERLYFGDMHTHTLDCDGTIDIAEHFNYAPHVAGLDFGAVSCHAEYFGCKAAWDRYLAETAAAHRPGRFVTFYGYEWANQGHTNAYFLDPGQVTLLYGPRLCEKGRAPDEPPFRRSCKTEGAFMSMLREHEHPVFCIAHCHTRYGEDVDDRVLWLDEIYSCHRRDRSKREEQLRHNLARGLRLGVVAGSDMHRLTMGHLCKQPGKIWPQGGREDAQYQTAGLQATFAGELTRRALYEGMRARHTYGTTGARIILRFHCGEQPLGSQVVLGAEETPTFHIDVGGVAPLTEVAFCHYDGESWLETPSPIEPGHDRWSGTRQGAASKREGIYYLRVTQADGEQAWSSPIWVRRA
ncbi:MAG: DUF3604 domain-containing protein [Candidatus Hydrogenedentota bacterium]